MPKASQREPAVWSKAVGGTGTDRALGMAGDGSGNVLLAGDFQQTTNFGGSALTSAGDNDIFVAKYAADGSHLSSRRFGGVKSDAASCVAAIDSSSAMLAGYFESTVDFGSGPLTSAGIFDIFVLKWMP